MSEILISIAFFIISSFYLGGEATKDQHHRYLGGVWYAVIKMVKMLKEDIGVHECHGGIDNVYALRVTTIHQLPV